MVHYIYIIYTSTQIDSSSIHPDKELLLVHIYVFNTRPSLKPPLPVHHGPPGTTLMLITDGLWLPLPPSAHSRRGHIMLHSGGKSVSRTAACSSATTQCSILGVYADLRLNTPSPKSALCQCAWPAPLSLRCIYEVPYQTYTLLSLLLLSTVLGFLAKFKRQLNPNLLTAKSLKKLKDYCH